MLSSLGLQAPEPWDTTMQYEPEVPAEKKNHHHQSFLPNTLVRMIYICKGKQQVFAWDQH